MHGRKKYILRAIIITTLFCAIYKGIVYFFSSWTPIFSGNLSGRDYLSFFGNYLSFFSTLLLSLLVYRQDRKITALTLAKNEVHIGFAIEAFEYGDITVDDCVSFRIPHPFYEDTNPPFYECNYFESKNVSEGKIIILSIKLYSSLNIPVKDLQLTQISIKNGTSSSCQETIYYPKGKEKKYNILPENNSLRICCIVCVPAFDSDNSDFQCQMKCSFTMYDGGHNQHLSFHILEQKNYLQAIDGTHNPRVYK